MPVGLAQDAPPFGSSPEYKSMLVELAHEAPRPSRIANAGELLMGKVPDVPVTDKESPDGLRLEAQAWRVEIARNPFAIAFTNKLTGAEWKLAEIGRAHV